MRKKWDNHTKLQLGKLIREQLDMQIKLKDAVDRAAEILQAPRSTCMNYWQKELKDLDYTQENLTLPERKRDRRISRASYLTDIDVISAGESTVLLSDLLERLRATEEKVRQLYLQAGILLNDYSVLNRELASALETHDQSNRQRESYARSMKAADLSELAAGDIICIHHHIWQDHYYITAIQDNTVHGYKLNKNMRIRRKSKAKIISPEMLQFYKHVRRNVPLEEVSAE